MDIANIEIGLLTPDQREKTVHLFEELARIKSANIVPILEIYQDDTHIYLVMAKIERNLLNIRIGEKGVMKESEAAQMTAALMRAIGNCHAKGIIHGSIRPSCLYLGASQDED